VRERIREHDRYLADWERDTANVLAWVLAEGQTGFSWAYHGEISVTDAAHLPILVIFNQSYEVLREKLTRQPVLCGNHRSFILTGRRICRQSRLIHLQAMEAHPIDGVAVPLKRRLLGSLGAHTRVMPIEVTDTAVGGEETTRLVMPISAAIVALDYNFLLTLRWIW
jgi:hypothetical protein